MMLIKIVAAGVVVAAGVHYMVKKSSDRRLWKRLWGQPKKSNVVTNDDFPQKIVSISSYSGPVYSSMW